MGRCVTERLCCNGLRSAGALYALSLSLRLYCAVCVEVCMPYIPGMCVRALYRLSRCCSSAMFTDNNGHTCALGIPFQYAPYTHNNRNGALIIFSVRLFLHGLNVNVCSAIQYSFEHACPCCQQQQLSGCSVFGAAVLCCGAAAAATAGQLYLSTEIAARAAAAAAGCQALRLYTCMVYATTRTQQQDQRQRNNLHSPIQ